MWAGHMSSLLKKQNKYSKEEIEWQNKWRTRLTNQRINDEVTLKDFKPKYSPERRLTTDSTISKRKPSRNI